MTTLMMQLVLAGGGEDNPAAVFVDDRSRRGWAMVEKRLGEAPFFGGANLTTADIMMVYCLTTSRAFRGTSLDGYPNLKAYLARIGARPAYQRAMAKAEPGMTPMLALTAAGARRARRGAASLPRSSARARGSAHRSPPPRRESPRSAQCPSQPGCRS